MNTERHTPEEQRAIACEILRQLGGRGFVAMTGAKDMIHGENIDGNCYLRIRLPRNLAANGIASVTIELTPKDCYTLTFKKPGRRLTDNWTTTETVPGIYCDSLRETFERATGLCLTVPRVFRAA